MRINGLDWSWRARVGSLVDQGVTHEHLLERVEMRKRGGQGRRRRWDFAVAEALDSGLLVEEYDEGLAHSSGVVLIDAVRGALLLGRFEGDS